MPDLIVDLARMKTGKTGKIVEILGGFGFLKRLESLGIRMGVEITKISGQFARGPVTVRVGNTHAAIGFGMAQKIMVEVQIEQGE